MSQAYTAPPEAQATLTEMGPAVSNFAGYHNLVLKDTYYIGSRGSEPARIAGYHLPTWRTAVVRDFPGFREISALVADGDLLYVAVRNQRKQTVIFSWDTVAGRVAPVATLPGLTIWALKVAADGLLYAVCGETLSVHEIDLRTGASRVLFTPDAATARPPTIVVTPDRIYFGAGGRRPDDAIRATLFTIDRATGAVSSILPAELAGDQSVVGLLLAGDRLFIGTKTETSPAHFAVMSLPGHDLEYIGQPGGHTGFWALLEAADGEVCFFSSTKVYRYLASAPGIEELADLGAVIAGGLQYYRGELLAMAWPVPWPAGPPATFLHRYDVTAGRLHTSEIPELAMPMRAEPVHALAAGGGQVYAAAWDLHRHDPRTRTVTKVLGMPRTIKAMAVAGGGAAPGRLYAAIHEAGELWSYDPVSDGMRRLGAFPQGRARPWDMAWDKDNDLIVVGTGAAQPGGGALGIYDPSRGDLRTYPDPCGPGDAVYATAPGDGLLFLAGADGGGHLACWDPVTGRRLWDQDAGHGAAATALTFGGGLLYGITRPGTFFAFDTVTRRLVHSAPLPPGLWPGLGKLVWLDGGRVYGASRDAVFRIDPGTLRVTVLASGLKGQWVGGRAGLAAGDDGELYTLRHRTLTCVRESS